MSLVLSLSTVLYNFRGFPCQSSVGYLSCLHSWPVCSYCTSPRLGWDAKSWDAYDQMDVSMLLKCTVKWKEKNEWIKMKWTALSKSATWESPSNGDKNQVVEERLALAHCAEWWGVFYLWNCFLIPTNARNPFQEKKKPYVKNSNPVISLKEKNMCMS